MCGLTTRGWEFLALGIVGREGTGLIYSLQLSIHELAGVFDVTGDGCRRVSHAPGSSATPVAETHSRSTLSPKIAIVRFRAHSSCGYHEPSTWDERRRANQSTGWHDAGAATGDHRFIEGSVQLAMRIPGMS